ncbi:MAG: ATPase, T2SS/T4P/T4SS family [Candidatus Micrarchaeota archaeon]
MPYLEELVSKTKAEQKGIEGIGLLPAEPTKPAEPAKPAVKEEEKILVEKYGDVRIYKVKGEALYRYEVPTPHYRGEEKALISALIEIASKVISPEREAGKTTEQRKFSYLQRILDIIDSSPELRVPPAAKEFYAEAVTREMVGWGLIDPLLHDDKLEDILLIGPNQPAYVFHRKYDMMKTNILFYDDKDIKDLIDRIARNIGRHIDIQSPLLDARLPDGTRVNATVPPASVNGSTLSIRKFRQDPITIVDLVNFGTLNYDAGAFLWLATDGFGAKPANIVISGGTASGKTTSLNVLASFIPNNERIITIEDTAELSLPLDHWVRFETRPPGMEGVGEITMDMLVKNSLRMRPDRIIVGEIRGEEGHTLFSAMNTGHDGVELATEPVYFSDGQIKEAERFFSENYSPGKVVKEGAFEYIPLANGPQVLALDRESLKLAHKPVLRIWRRPRKDGEKMIRITTNGKRQIALSHDHPAYRINDEGFLEQVHASQLRNGDLMATPRIIRIDSETIEATFSHRKKNSARLESVDEKIAYCTGVLLGDGHLGRSQLSIDIDDRSVIDAFNEKITAFTDAEMHVTYLKDKHCWRACNGCMSLPKLFNEVFEVPLGNKTKKFAVPQKILASPDSVVAAFLRGIYDCEAFVGTAQQGIVFVLSNKKAISQIKHLLLRFGMQSRLYEQEKDGHGNRGPYYRLVIYDKQSIAKFAKNIGFNHAKKKSKLKQLVVAVGNAKKNTNVDLVPAASLVKKVRNALRLTQEELSVLAGFGKTRAVVRNYECGQRVPSTAALKQTCAALVKKFNERTALLKRGFNRMEQVVEEWPQQPSAAAHATLELLGELRLNASLLEKNSGLGHAYLHHFAKGTMAPGKQRIREVCAALNELLLEANFELADAKKTILHLQALANSDVVFEKIIGLKETPATPFVYDLTVEDCHTYLSGTNGGIFISNCMGTLHANSAKETLIRLANPPISIPLIMLQSLNFIVMQQRINDRRKGLIRRITEIAEIISVEENQMPKLQILYQWDPAKDVLASTGMNSMYMQTLSRYTGFSRETLLEEISTRAKILQELNNRNVRGLKEVCSVTQNYILRTRGKI